MRGFVAAAMMLAALLASDVVRGDDPAPAATTTATRDDARQMVVDAAAQYDAGEYAAAAANLEKAYAVLGEPRLLYNIARSHDRAKNRTMALDTYRRYLAGSAVEPELGERARQAIARLEAAAPKSSASASAAPAAAPPPAQKPARDAAEEPTHALSTTLLVVGAGALVAGIAIGVWASSTAGSARDSTDPVEKPALRDAAQNRALAADLLLLGGGLAVGSGLVFRFFVETPPRATPVSGQAAAGGDTALWTSGRDAALRTSGAVVTGFGLAARWNLPR